MNRKTIAAIRAHVIAEYPREACGLVVLDGQTERYMPCRNTAAGTEHFILCPEDYAAAEDAGQIIAVIHSHPDQSAEPSTADLVSCEASGLPWYIAAVAKGDDGGVTAGEIRGLAPEGYQAPLLGRPFAHGVLDCYTLVRDWYKRERGIDLPNFTRRDDWWNQGDNLYVKHYEEAGFRPMSEAEPLQTGDVIVMQYRSPNDPNHAGIYLGTATLKECPDLHPVPDAMLHHLYGRLSERVVYGGHWQEMTRLRLRYSREK
jgi:proteasome lid subunit RPN8/RPN11